MIRFSALGDLILVSPVLEYLNRKGEVFLLTYENYASLYSSDPRLRGIITLPRGGGYRKIKEIMAHLRQLKFSALFDLQVKPMSVLLGLMLQREGVAVVKTDKRSLQRRLHVWFGLPLEYRYVPDNHLKRVAAFFGEPPPSIRPRIFPPSETLHIPSPYVILSPEASTPLKRWPMERFFEVARELEKEGVVPVWVGLEKEADTKVGIDLRGETDLHNLVGIISKASAVLTNDSSALHIAYAVGVPAVVILGPTVTNFGFVPKDSSVRIVQRNLKCRPCSTNGSGRCWVGDRRCMDIGSDEVMEVLLRVVRGNQRS
ncbi:MAG: glycosyltransferase family 9 protein [Thermotogae bacterium]|nr:glycosyltransferase family 9 protein [Thermotogota bacterium]